LPYIVRLLTKKADKLNKAQLIYLECEVRNVKLKEVLQEIEKGNPTEELVKKRFACAHCGSTWTELVGLLVMHNDGNEELCLRIGMEPESCQMCQLQARECQKCGSKDVYEISFAKEVPQGAPLSFKEIRTVSRR
jgi:hypothetical protein